MTDGTFKLNIDGRDIEVLKHYTLMQGREEAYTRPEHRRKHGDTDEALGWSYLRDAVLYKAKKCQPVAAE